MDNLKNKVAFVTGGAGGIGFGLATAFGRHGMQVMLADIEAGALREAVENLRAAGVDADGLVLDVADRAAVKQAAARTVERFGKVHVVCNNAGVTVNGPIGNITAGDWNWVIDVNLMGEIYGAEAFLPYIRAHGEGGHIVNTASAAGVLAIGNAEPYVGTKYGVVAISECWNAELAAENIGVSVLCPSFVQSRIYDSKRSRDARYGETAETVAELDLNNLKELVDHGTPADVIGERVVEAIYAKELFIFPHVEIEPMVLSRYEAMLSGFRRAAASPHIPRELASSLPDFMRS